MPRFARASHVAQESWPRAEAHLSAHVEAPNLNQTESFFDYEGAEKTALTLPRYWWRKR